MKKLNLALNIEGLSKGPGEEDKSPIEICVQVIKNIVLNGNSKGLSEEDRRRFYKLIDVFDKAIKENLQEVELEDDWLGFIKRSKREAKFIPSDLTRRVEQLIDDVKDR